ncbi:MAG: radical SAM protein [Deltaproteobacteria bacterium]|uniref:Radical SAM protein n=1 Tax=Candidatus Zymogenus saltonus TaxID=2844893 RepID=A0A9D8KFL6_9DELT|nr:radical SAM protein [Candidatus Zymogenus saltonus]
MIPIRNIGRALKKAKEFPGYALKALIQRSRSGLSYFLFRGRSAPPETVSLLLTYRCNLRCKMCGQWGETGSSKFYTPEVLREELDVKEVGVLVDHLKRAYAFPPAITLFGGEPLLYSGIIEVIERIKKNGMRLNIITNATLLKKYAKDLVRAKLDEIIFSLDGPPDVHDMVRGRKGVFDDAKEGFLILDEEKRRLKTTRPVVNVNSTIFDFNYLAIPETVKSARSLGAREVTFHHLIFIDGGRLKSHNMEMREQYGCESHDWAGFVLGRLPAIDTKLLREKLNEAKSMGATVYPNLTDDEIEVYYTNFTFSPRSYSGRCKSPWMVAYIFPDGTVRPCLSLGVKIGNIRERPFAEIWNDHLYRRFRRRVKERGRFDVCDRCTELYRF